MPFIADYISILQNSIISKFEEKYTRTESLDMYTRLNSAYNVPNIFFPIIGGIMNDLYGYRVTMLMYQINLVVGQALITLSFFLVDQPFFLYIGCLGRFLLGMSDSIEIPTFSMIFQWFDETETMTASSNLFLFQTIVQMLANYYVPKIVYFKSLNFAMILASVVTLVGFIAAVFLFLIDKYKFKKQIQTQESTGDMKQGVRNLPKIFWVAFIATNLPFSIYFSFLIFQIQLLEIQLLKHSPNLTRYELIDQETVLSSLTYLIQIPLYPLLGYILDKYGYRIKLMYLSVYAFLISFLIFDKLHPVYSVILNGFFMALNICVSRSIFQFIVKKNQIGLGLGILNSFISVLIIVFNYVASEIFKDENNEYCTQNCILFYYIFLVSLNILFCHVLGYIDRKRAVSLNTNRNVELENLINLEISQQNEKNEPNSYALRGKGNNNITNNNLYSDEIDNLITPTQ